MPKSRYIEWNQVPPNATLKLVGPPGARSYRYKGKTVIWNAFSSDIAINYLDGVIARNPKTRKQLAPFEIARLRE